MDTFIIVFFTTLSNNNSDFADRLALYLKDVYACTADNICKYGFYTNELWLVIKVKGTWNKMRTKNEVIFNKVIYRIRTMIGNLVVLNRLQFSSQDIANSISIIDSMSANFKNNFYIWYDDNVIEIYFANQELVDHFKTFPLFQLPKTVIEKIPTLQSGKRTAESSFYIDDEPSIKRHNKIKIMDLISHIPDVDLILTTSKKVNKSGIFFNNTTIGIHNVKIVFIEFDKFAEYCQQFNMSDVTIRNKFDYHYYPNWFKLDIEVLINSGVYVPYFWIGSAPYTHKNWLPAELTVWDLPLTIKNKKHLLKIASLGISPPPITASIPPEPMVSQEIPKPIKVSVPMLLPAEISAPIEVPVQLPMQAPSRVVIPSIEFPQFPKQLFFQTLHLNPSTPTSTETRKTTDE